MAENKKKTTTTRKTNKNMIQEMNEVQVATNLAESNITSETNFQENKAVLVSEKKIQLSVSVVKSIDVPDEVTSVVVENFGAGDLYADPENAVYDIKNIVRPGESKEFKNAKTLVLISTCKPVVSIKFYK